MELRHQTSARPRVSSRKSEIIDHIRETSDDNGDDCGADARLVALASAALARRCRRVLLRRQIPFQCTGGSVGAAGGPQWYTIHFQICHVW